MQNLNTIISTSIELGTARTLEVLGVSSGEISQRKALKVYGKWFAEALATHKIQPCRVEEGRTGTRWFRVVDILAAKVRDAARYEITFKSLYNERKN